MSGVWCWLSAPGLVHMWDGSSLLYVPSRAPKTGLLTTRAQKQKLHGPLRPRLSAVGAQLALGWGALNLSMFTLLQIKENHVADFPIWFTCFMYFGTLPLLRQLLCFPPERLNGTPSFGTHFLCEQDCEGCHPGVYVGWGPHSKCCIVSA